MSNPTIRRSLSGGYVLTIVPSHNDGRGGATYAMTKGGSELWSQKLPYTLWDAAVSNTGIVSGYGYTLGREGTDDT